MEEIYIGRQPIFDRDLNVVAYELLFRGNNLNRAEIIDGNHATSVVLTHTFLEMGLNHLVGDKVAFVNLTRPFLLGEYPLPEQKDRLVLEVLEDILIDNELIRALEKLSQKGYKLALDDVVNPLDVAPVLDIAHIVKIDIMASDLSVLPSHVPVYKARNVQILAEKVETQEEFEQCKAMGFDLFQGYFLQKPEVIKGKKLSPSKVTIMRLLSQLQEPEAAFEVIEESIKQDVTLSYKLLRLINSAYFGTRSKVTSIHQALTLLGLQQIYSWVSILLISESESKPTELIKTALIRAKMSEGLAKVLKVKQTDSYFTVGLFSVLDALMDMSLEDILEQVPLSEDINQALLCHNGDLGDMLECILAYEKGTWELAHFHDITIDCMRNAYFEAVEWADSIASHLHT